MRRRRVGRARGERRVGSGRPVEDADFTYIDDVVDVGEVPAHLAVAEHPDRLSGQDRFREQHRRHVGASPRAVHGEEPQDNRRGETAGLRTRQLLF